MIKMRSAQGDHDQAAAAVEYVIRVAEDIASRAPVANDRDLQLVLMSARRQSADFQLLEKVVAEIGDVAAQDAVYDGVTKLMLGAFLIGCGSCLSPEATRWREQIATYAMREKRATKDAPRKAALGKQIQSSKAFQAGASADAVFEELRTGKPPGSKTSLSTVKRRIADLKA